MSVQDIIRAWKADEDDEKDEKDEKDESDKSEEQAPANPAGEELSDEDLEQASGGLPPHSCYLLSC